MGTWQVLFLMWCAAGLGYGVRCLEEAIEPKLQRWADRHRNQGSEACEPER